MEKALMLSRARQCGSDTAKMPLLYVEAVATMERPSNYSYLEFSETILYSAFTLQLHGLPYDFASFQSADPINMTSMRCCTFLPYDP
jgi:hypothetical protein